MSATAGTAAEREEALREWREQTELHAGLDRRFSGDRIKRAFTGDRLTKAAFVVGTGAVLYFVLSHDSKEQRVLNREARAATQLEEPSVRDFRPPVMPARLAAEVSQAPPQASPATIKPEQPQATQIDAEAIAKRRRAEQLEEARLKSDIVVKTSAGPVLAGTVGASAVPAVRQTDANAAAEGQPTSMPLDPNSAFAKQVSGRPVPTSLPHRRVNLQCVALQGKLIDAELETAINTDLPGQIRAIVSAPLYAEQGREPLITAGSRLVGTYSSAVQKGQVRVFAVWNRAIRPDGVEIVLDSQMSDALGRSGAVGETDNHFLQVFGTSLLLSVIGAGTSIAGVSSDTLYNSVDEYRRQVQQSFGRTADQLLQPYGRIPPTNTIRQGERIKVFLNRDLDFCSLAVAQAERRELILP